MRGDSDAVPRGAGVSLSRGGRPTPVHGAGGVPGPVVPERSSVPGHLAVPSPGPLPQCKASPGPWVGFVTSVVLCEAVIELGFYVTLLLHSNPSGC